MKQIRFWQPFWPVTLISGSLTLLTLLALVVFYNQTGQWQYLALAGLVIMIVVAHGLAWGIAWSKKRFDLGIWLIATAQILSAVLAPLFMADYWLIGPFLLTSVPLEVGTADQLKRIPLFIVLSLLGAAVMLVTDLLALPNRVLVLTGLPSSVFLAVMLFVLFFAGQGLLLWYFRLRPDAGYGVRLNLATQQTLLLTGIAAVSIVLVTGVLIAQIRASQIEQVGQNFQTVAEIEAERVGNDLSQQINILTLLIRQEPDLLEGLETANASYPEAEADARRLLQAREQRWQTSPDNSDFVLQYRSNLQSLALSRFRGTNNFHNRVFLTDRLGGLVAAQGDRPAKFYYGDEPWWQTAWSNGRGDIYLGQLIVDPQTKTAFIFMAVGLINPKTNKTIGVIASTYGLGIIQHNINLARPQTTGEATLLAPDGLVVAGPDEQGIGQPAWRQLLTTSILPAKEADFSQLEPGWLLENDRQNRSAVLAYAPLNTTSRARVDRLRSLGWQVVVSDTQTNALALVTRSTKIASLVAVLTLALVVLAATAMARVITRPIDALTTTATAVTDGDLDQQAEPVGPVELVTLAEAFNNLTARLRTLISNLQEQVAQRTAQLETLFKQEQQQRHMAESRTEQLTTLNRITQAAASADDLQAALETIAREMVALIDSRGAGIALLNDARTELSVVASYSRAATQPSSVGIVIPLADNPSSMQVVETGRSVVVPQAQTNPLTAPIHHIMHQRDIQGLMIVPLLVQGQVIGTIGLTTDLVDREFTPGDVGLAETVAGQVAGVLERARLFEEMQQAKEAAEAANQAKSDFLAGVSHELRTPLTSVLGFAKISQKRLEKLFPKIQADDRRTKRDIRHVRENIEIIVAEGERLTTLINNVLDLAKIEAGKVEWNMQPLALTAVIERATAATAALFEHKELELIKDVAPDLPEIVGDEDKLIQVVINLISNAVKFTNEGSITCQARQVANEIVVSVIDTGMGIAPADQPQVFEKFKQVGDTLTDKPQGTGLGLPICKEIVEHHGGRIWVESELGHGSTFSFALSVQWIEIEDEVISQPVDLATLVKQLKEQVVAAAPNSTGQQKIILVVDDEAPVRKLLKQELGEAGYQVKEATNGQEALLQIRRNKPDLVILDVLMPNMNGFNVAAILKNDPQTIDLPIIMLTIVEDAERGYRLGVDRYLIKPIDTKALFTDIEGLLAHNAFPRKVLIVDEDAATVQTLAEVFKEKGYQVTEAHTAAEFIERAVSANPNIILVNATFSEQGNVARTARFEQGLSNVMMLFYQE